MGSPTSSDKEFVEYLQSTVRLDALEKMTTVLDQELADSQRMLADMKTMFDSLSTQRAPVDSELRQEDLAKFLAADVPNLLLPDMVETNLENDLNEVVSEMRVYVENLRRNTPEVSQTPPLRKELSRLELEQYASSMDQLARRLANIKLHKQKDDSNRNMELEEKLTQLCQGVNMFTKVVEAKTALCEQNKNWSEIRQSNTLCYDGIIKKLLDGINEVTYLLQNKT